MSDHPLVNGVRTVTEERDMLKVRLKRAIELLREWRDEFGGKAVHRFGPDPAKPLSASPSDLLRETQRFIEGKS